SDRAASLCACAVPATISAAAAQPRRAKPRRSALQSHPCLTRAGIDIRFTPKKPFAGASVAERHGRRTLDIAAEAIRDDLDESDLVLRDRQDAPVVLSHVVAHLHTVNQPI